RRTMMAAPIGALAAAALAAALLIPGGSSRPTGPAEGFKAVQTPRAGDRRALQSASAPPSSFAPVQPQAAPAPSPSRAAILAAPATDQSRPQDVRTWTRVHVDDVGALSRASARAMTA